MDGLWEVFNFPMLELVVVYIVTDDVCLFFLKLTWDKVVIGVVALGVAIMFDVNVKIKLIRLKGDSHKGHDVFWFSCILNMDTVNVAM